MWYDQTGRDRSKARGMKRYVEWENTEIILCMCMFLRACTCVCVKKQSELCINLLIANRKLSSHHESGSCVCAYMWITAVVKICGLYGAVQSNTFNYVCEWIWEKVNCSVKLGNWLSDVWSLITWHFYYSKGERWREQEEKKRAKIHLCHGRDLHREHVKHMTGFQQTFLKSK